MSGSSSVLVRSPHAETSSRRITAIDWLHLIRAEYLEIPGLVLTRAQVRRLWSLDDVTCDAVLRALVNAGFLRQTRTGSYVRAE